jgi:hypothetical protein
MFSRNVIEDSRSINDTYRVMPQFGASLPDNSRVIIHNHNTSILQPIGLLFTKHLENFIQSLVRVGVRNSNKIMTF